MFEKQTEAHKSLKIAHKFTDTVYLDNRNDYSVLLSPADNQVCL